MNDTSTPRTSTRGRRRWGEKPTLSDVAKHAGVSPMTVSRVINQSTSVRSRTKSKVEDAIRTLGYVPNSAARALAGARQCRIAMLYSNPSAAYLSEFLIGGLEGAALNNAELIVQRWESGECLETLADRLRDQRVDAVLLPPPLCENSPLLDSLTHRSLRVAQVATGNLSPEYAAVTIDDVAAAETMTRHFIEGGHRSIGFINGAPGLSVSAMRRIGYEAALRSAGLSPNPDLVVHGDFTYRSGLAAAQTLLGLAPRPTAIFASNDDMAAAVVAVAHRLGLAVPDDLSVGGFDDTAMATTIWPELTTVRQPIAEMARTAIDLLVQGATDSPKNKHRHVALRFELLVRGSSGPVKPAD